MSQQKAQLISPIDTFTPPGLNVSGVVTSTSFVGSGGTVTGLSGTPNLTVGVITATSYYGSGANLTGVGSSAFVGQSTTSQSPTTTINLALGNVIYFTHNTDTTVAFANTSAVQKVKFIRIKDATQTARNITWTTSVYWDGGTAPTLITNPRTTAAQIFNFTTRDGGVTWYAYEEVNANPQTFALYSWGINNNGQSGQNNRTYYSSPVQIPGTAWSSISSSNYYSLATKTDGTLWAWGTNGGGRLGQNNTTEYSSPVQIPGTQWSSISGGGHSLATKTDGTLWSWGLGTTSFGRGGQLGLNDTIPRSSPVQIPGTTWSSVSAGGADSLAIKTDGTSWAWGDNRSGQLGLNNTISYSSPLQISGTNWRSVDIGDYSTLASKTDGTLWSWGYNGQGILGLNDTADRSSPRQIPGTQWSSISSSSSTSSLATKTDGTLWSWGNNSSGQLGINDTVRRSSPTQIPGTQWNTVSAGSQHSLTTKTDGTLWSWGENGFGQLGINDIVDRSSPTQVSGTQWSSISISGSASLTTQYR